LDLRRKGNEGLKRTIVLNKRGADEKFKEITRVLGQTSAIFTI
jgi:hypothetical protein